MGGGGIRYPPLGNMVKEMKVRSNINELQSSNPEQGHLNVDSPNSLADIGTPQPTLDFIFFSVFYISLRMATQNKYQPSGAAGTHSPSALWNTAAPGKSHHVLNPKWPPRGP